MGGRRSSKWVLVLLVVGMAVLLAACAAGPNAQLGTPDSGGDTAGFFMGLWHGVISPFTLIVSIFTDEVSVYEVHNTGNWYDVGFVFGAVALIGGPSASRRGRRK